jgi:hypothetical protein
MKICGIGKLYYGASLAQSGKAFANVSRTARRPIDIDELRDEAGGTLETRSQPSEQKRDAEAVRILEEWAASRSS